MGHRQSRKRSKAKAAEAAATLASGAGSAPTPAAPKAPAREVKAASPEKAAPNPHPLLILISAPSGGGKTTLQYELLKARPEITRAVTCTTRPPRDGERDTIDYYFLDAGSFLKRVQAGNFLEHATVYSNSYGTLKAEVLGKLRSGKHVLLSVDVQGAASIRRCADEDPELKRALVSVFLTPDSIATLEKRLLKRGKDSPAVIHKRLAVARQEIAQWKNFDYLIISTTIANDLHHMIAIYEAEKMRPARVVPPQF